MSTGKFYGAAVQDGQIRYLSVSQIAHFSPNEDGGCPRKWWFRRVLRLPEPERDWQTEGTKAHGQVEHYLKTGEDVLGRIASPAKELLPVPHPDLLIEHGFHDRSREPNEIMHDPAESWLVLEGVPLVGFMDLMIPQSHQLIEVSDHKTSKDPEKWGKTPEQLRALPQLLGYAAWGLLKFPGTRRVRLSHVYMRTDKSRAPLALKRTVLVSADEIKEKWYGRIGETVRQMKEVAGEKQEAAVPGNLAACSDYGGCAYRGRCSAFTNQSPMAKLSATIAKGKGNMANLFEKVTSAASGMGMAGPPQLMNGAGPAAPPPSIAKGLPILSPTAPVFMASAAEQQKHYVLPNGQTGIFLCTTKGKFSFLPVDANGVPTGQPELLDGHVPVTPISTEIAEGSAVSISPLLSKSPPPPPPVLADAPAKRGPGRPRKAVDPAPTAPPSSAEPAARSLVLHERSLDPIPNGKIAPIKDSTLGLHGNWLFVDCEPFHGLPRLEPFIWKAVEDLARANAVSDVRFSTDGNHPLAFGRWKGALAATVRAEPPEGAFVVRSGSEFADVVIEALAPFFGAQVVRSIR